MEGFTLKGRNYRIGKGRAYTRKEYIHGAPQPKITKFTMGDTTGKFSHKLSLVSLKRVQIRHNALEAARVAVNKILSEKLGSAYILKIRPYPHIVLRENKMMAFAGADRLQEGMRRSFGKATGLAAQVEVGEPIIDVEVDAPGVDVAKRALNTGMSKLPTPCTIEIVTLHTPEKPAPTPHSTLELSTRVASLG
ncbi:MAG: 50S ribosomal protein L16 [Candidatus Bathyarchaeia archaeon]